MLNRLEMDLFQVWLLKLFEKGCRTPFERPWFRNSAHNQQFYLPFMHTHSHIELLCHFCPKFCVRRILFKSGELLKDIGIMFERLQILLDERQLTVWKTTYGSLVFEFWTSGPKCCDRNWNIIWKTVEIISLPASHWKTKYWKDHSAVPFGVIKIWILFPLSRAIHVDRTSCQMWFCQIENMWF